VGDRVGLRGEEDRADRPPVVGPSIGPASGASSQNRKHSASALAAPSRTVFVLGHR